MEMGPCTIAAGYIRAMAGHRIEDAMALLAPDAEVEDPGRPGAAYLDRTRYRRWLQGLLAAFPDFDVQLAQCHQSGDLAFSEFVFTGTHRGEWLGIRATGKAVSFRGIFVDQVRDGLIVHRRAYWDSAALLRSLGVLPRGI